MGVPSTRGALARLARPGLIERLVQALPGVAVRIVADRGQRPKEDR